jgi:hypothetical protein
MKKLFLLSASLLLFVSCDYILKDRSEDDVEVKTEKKVVLGADKDAQGCVASAGYRWSAIRKECIRVFEEGYRLNTIEELKTEDISKSAFVVFEEDGHRAELFLPGDNVKPIMLERANKNAIYKNKEWTLHSDKNYTLKKNGKLLYAGAVIEEKQITGDDQEES